MENKEQEILLKFIGSNYGVMKELDGQIIGSSTSLQPRSQELKRVVEQVVQHTSQQTPQQVQSQITVQPTIQQPITQPQSDQRSEDDSQLWLDFSKRDEIYDRLDRIEEKVDLILKRLEKLNLQSNISRNRAI